MSEELAHQNSPSTCPKCSAPLRSDIYFCAYCAEGWRRPFQGLEAAPEPVWDAETRIRLRASGAYEACWLYLIAMLVAWIGHLILNGNDDYNALDLILEASGLSIASLWLVYRNFDTVKASIRLKGLVSPWFVLAGVLLLPMLAINHLYHAFLLSETSVVINPFIYDLAERDPWLAGLFICLIPAVFEELGFRAYIFPILKRAITPVWAAVISSALFATLHFSFWSWPYLFSFGLLMAFTATKCRSVLPCVLLHFAHNYAVLFLLPRL